MEREQYGNHCIYYDTNGQKSAESFGYKDGNKIHTEWYGDGSLNTETILDENGNFVEYWDYYENGIKSLEYTFVGNKQGKVEIKAHNAWDRQGKQIVKDGTGVIRRSVIGGYEIVEYQNGFIHGKITTYRNDVLDCIAIYEHGERMKADYFDEQGNLKCGWSNEL